MPKKKKILPFPDIFSKPPSPHTHNKSDVKWSPRYSPWNHQRHWLLWLSGDDTIGQRGWKV